MRKIILMFALVVMMAVILSACGGKKDTNNDITSVNDGSMGDLRVETSSVNELPSFLNDHHENMQVLYRGVANHQELLEHIPCYCGCGDSVGHDHNLDCFIHDTNEDDGVTWDDHATRCQVCLDIAAESIVEFQEGNSVNEVRQLIEDKYEGKGYPEATDTPQFAS